MEPVKESAKSAWKKEVAQLWRPTTCVVDAQTKAGAINLQAALIPPTPPANLEDCPSIMIQPDTFLLVGVIKAAWDGTGFDFSGSLQPTSQYLIETGDDVSLRYSQPPTTLWKLPKFLLSGAFGDWLRENEQYDGVFRALEGTFNNVHKYCESAQGYRLFSMDRIASPENAATVETLLKQFYQEQMAPVLLSEGPLFIREDYGTVQRWCSLHDAEGRGIRHVTYDIFTTFHTEDDKQQQTFTFPKEVAEGVVELGKRGWPMVIPLWYTSWGASQTNGPLHKLCLGGVDPCLLSMGDPLFRSLDNSHIARLEQSRWAVGNNHWIRQDSPGIKETTVKNPPSEWLEEVVAVHQALLARNKSQTPPLFSQRLGEALGVTVQTPMIVLERDRMLKCCIRGKDIMKVVPWSQRWVESSLHQVWHMTVPGGPRSCPSCDRHNVKQVPPPPGRTTVVLQCPDCGTVSESGIPLGTCAFTGMWGEVITGQAAESCTLRVGSRTACIVATDLLRTQRVGGQFFFTCHCAHVWHECMPSMSKQRDEGRDTRTCLNCMREFRMTTLGVWAYTGRASAIGYDGQVVASDYLNPRVTLPVFSETLRLVLEERGWRSKNDAWDAMTLRYDQRQIDAYEKFLVQKIKEDNSPLKGLLRPWLPASLKHVVSPGTCTRSRDFLQAELDKGLDNLLTFTTDVGCLRDLINIMEPLLCKGRVHSSIVAIDREISLLYNALTHYEDQRPLKETAEGVDVHGEEAYNEGAEHDE